MPPTTPAPLHPSHLITVIALAPLQPDHPSPTVGHYRVHPADLYPGTCLWLVLHASLHPNAGSACTRLPSLTRVMPRRKCKGSRASVFTSVYCGGTYSMGRLSGLSAMRTTAVPQGSGTGRQLYPGRNLYGGTSNYSPRCASQNEGIY